MIGTININPLTRDTVAERADIITIPSDLIVGQRYYVGVIIDYDSRLTELLETNNSSYVGIIVQ